MRKANMESHMQLKFKQLSIGARFEFDHTGLPPCHGLEPGPWVKTSSRGYQKDTTPFTLDQISRNEHAIYSTMKCTVGSINTTVIKLS